MKSENVRTQTIEEFSYIYTIRLY